LTNFLMQLGKNCSERTQKKSAINREEISMRGIYGRDTAFISKMMTLC